jgi:hypothetical protein
MRKIAAFIIFLAAALLASIPAAATEVVRSFRQQLPTGTADRIHLDFPVGEVRVEGWDNRQVDLDVQIACDHQNTERCRATAKRLRLVYNTDQGQLEIKIADWPSLGAVRGLHVIAILRVPRSLPLRADLGVGKLSINGTTGNLTADLGVGEVRVTLPKEAVASARVDTGVGDANLIAGGRHYESSGLVARKIFWDKGTGHARVKVDCGVGEIHVTLA